MERNDLKATIRNSILILLFEFIGTTFLTLLYLCNAEVSCRYHYSPKLAIDTFGSTVRDF